MFFHKKNPKLSSFGIIEAIVASFIVVLIISGAVALSSSSLKGELLNNSYFEAEHIADNVMEQITAAKSAGNVYFDSASRTPAQLATVFSIDCFDTFRWNDINCKTNSSGLRPELPYSTNVASDFKDNYVKVKSQDLSPAFPDGYFSWNLKIESPSQTNQNFNSCQKIGDFQIPLEKCRLAEIDVKWTESSGEKHYYLTQYFTDWSSQ